MTFDEIKLIRLIARHRMKHGTYPRKIGLGVIDNYVDIKSWLLDNNMNPNYFEGIPIVPMRSKGTRLYKASKRCLYCGHKG